MTTSVPVDGGRLRLEVADCGAGPAVMLLHGFPDDRHVWRKQVPALLSAGYRVIVPDQRGCGDSDMAQGVADYALPLLVDDLVAILDHLGSGPIKLLARDVIG